MTASPLFYFNTGGFEKATDQVEPTAAEDELNCSASTVSLQNLSEGLVAEPDIATDLIGNAAEQISFLIQGTHRSIDGNLLNHILGNPHALAESNMMVPFIGCSGDMGDAKDSYFALAGIEFTAG